MSSIVKIQEFKLESERFSMYVERLKLYFEANGVAANKQVAVFLTVTEAKSNKPKDQDTGILLLEKEVYS